MLIYSLMQPPRFDDQEAAYRVATPGVSVGLVWTTFGGEVQFVEATATVGNGELHLTGQLGDVIKESAQIALTWVYSLDHIDFLHLSATEIAGDMGIISWITHIFYKLPSNLSTLQIDDLNYLKVAIEHFLSTFF